MGFNVDSAIHAAAGFTASTLRLVHMLRNGNMSFNKLEKGPVQKLFSPRGKSPGLVNNTVSVHMV